MAASRFRRQAAVFGLSQTETLLILHVPVGISLLLAFFLLSSWRRVRALIVAVLALCVYGTIGGEAAASSFVGAIMLLMLGWATVFFLALALWFSTRPLKVAPPVRPNETGKIDARRAAGSPVARVLVGALLVLLGLIAALVAFISAVWALNGAGSQRFVLVALCLFSSLLVLACVWCLWRIRRIAVSKLAQMLVVSYSLLFLGYITTVRW
jgi:hypothetical protein